MHTRSIAILLASIALLSFVLVACGPGADSPAPVEPVDAGSTAEPTQASAASPTPQQILLPTITPDQPTAEASSSQDWTQVATVVGDRFILGDLAAPVRLTDYSDFL